jgi:hypothetical protein
VIELEPPTGARFLLGGSSFLRHRKQRRDRERKAAGESFRSIAKSFGFSVAMLQNVLKGAASAMPCCVRSAK